jgi:hypothetical protein
MHQSVVAYDVVSPAMTPLSPGTERRIEAHALSRVGRPAGVGRNGPQMRRNGSFESLVSYLAVAGIAFGLVAAWAAFCAI